MSGKFIGCTAYIYDIDGNMLTTSKIYDHDRYENSIDIPRSQTLLDNQACSLFILSSPKPYACSGIVRPNGAFLTIKLLHIKERENRNAVRYNVSGKAVITTYICEGKKYVLHKPIEVDVLNISTSGVRFRTVLNLLSVDDKFVFYITVGDNNKTLTAKAVNRRDVGGETSEYGCALMGDEE